MAHSTENANTDTVRACGVPRGVVVVLLCRVWIQRSATKCNEMQRMQRSATNAMNATNRNEVQRMQRMQERERVREGEKIEKDSRGTEFCRADNERM